MAHMYLSPEGARNLHTFKYSGGDQSILYQNVLSPLAECISAYLPGWVSANLVSFSGYLCLMAGYVLCWSFCGLSLACSPPAWVLWTALALQVSWLVLDNVDGKQARRLGISSPLGLLFDHQIDSLCVFTTATLIAIVCGFGDSPYALGCFFSAMIPFYFATWEELNAGKLEFPKFTGPSEGVILCCSFLAFVIYQTPETMLNTLLWGYPSTYVVFWVFMALALINSVMSVARVAVNCEDSGKAVLTALPLGFFFVAAGVAIWLSPANLGYVAVRELIIFLGYLFAREMGHMQAAHVTATHYSPLNLPNFVLFMAFFVNTWTHSQGYGLVDEYHLLVFLTLASIVSYNYMAYTLCHEIASELGIPILAVPKLRSR